MRDPRPSRVGTWAKFALGVVVGAGFFGFVALVLMATGGDLQTPLRAKYLPPAGLVVAFAAMFGIGVWAYSVYALRSSLHEIREATRRRGR